MRTMLLWLNIIVMIANLQTAQPVQAAPQAGLILSVKVSEHSSRQTELVLHNHRIAKPLLDRRYRRPASAIPVTDCYITIHGKTSTILSVDRLGNVFDPAANEVIHLKSDIRDELIDYFDQLRKKHYGSSLPWKEAAELLPRRSVFKVTDIETGLSFQVQRRAGKNHADVQPLTKEDTAIMEQIYEGKWSWRRKAILVQAGDRSIAASMHGMPHGGDGIPDNNFSGHFCIHFLGSATHGSGNIDPEHQFMIRKAAGQWGDYLNRASPAEVIDSFLLALKLKERQFVKMSFVDPHQQHTQFFLNNMETIVDIAAVSKTDVGKLQAKEELNLEIPVSVHITRNPYRKEKATYVFQMKRPFVTDPWKIDYISMVSDLEPDPASAEHKAASAGCARSVS
jgi:hypothetical protein